jgi:hypothetical protein
LDVVKPPQVGVCDLAWELTMSQHPKNDPKTATQTEKAKIGKDELREQELEKATGGISLPFTKIEKEYVPDKG